MPNDPTKPKDLLALRRFEIVCHLQAQRQSGLPLCACLQAASARPWPAEGGAYYAYRTLETWWYDYQKGGYPALCGKPARTDAGQSRSLDEATGLWLVEQIKESPGTPLQVLLRYWRAQGKALPSSSSVYRYLKAAGYDRRTLRAGRLESGPQKAFEAPAPNDLWMVDFATGPSLHVPGGKALGTHLCVLIDDHSRLIPFAAYYLAADTASFLHTLKEAVLRRGLPHKLYTDQGGPFINHHAKIVCANLGIRLLHAKPYHAWSKGKIERLIQTIQQDFEMTLRLPGGRVEDLAALNAALSRWIAEIYQLRVHSSTGQSPHARFAGSAAPVRTLEDPARVEALFYTRAERVVRKDGTVTLGKKLLEVPLELRFDPQSFERIEVWHRGRMHGLARVADLQRNSQTHRGTNYER